MVTSALYQVFLPLQTHHFLFLFLLLIQARVEKHHKVLEIGCGWGSLAIEVVRRTGCRYTGITLSEEQLKFAQQRVKEAGLQVGAFVSHHYDEYLSNFLIFPFCYFKHHAMLRCCANISKVTLFVDGCQ